MAKQKKEIVPDYYEKDENISNLVKEIIDRDFADLLNANVGVIVKYSEKQSVSKTPAKLHLVNKINRYFNGMDFIMEIENNILRELDPEQLEHLIYRALSYGTINEKGEYKLQGPDYQFFRPELKKFADKGLYDIMEVINTIRDNKASAKPGEFAFEDQEFDN